MLVAIGFWVLGIAAFVAASSALCLGGWLLFAEEGQRLLGEVIGCLALLGLVLAAPFMLTAGFWFAGRAVWTAIHG